MKNILILILTLASFTCSAITFHDADSTCPYRYANILYTDSAKHIYNIPMKWACNPTDYRDTTLGCATTNYLYYVDGTQYLVIGSQFRGEVYNTWSNDNDLYEIIVGNWNRDKKYVTFLP